MHNRHRLRMLKKAFKMAGADKIIILYLICFILLSFAIWIWEPGIDSFFDSLWFCFATATSIGYGDYSAVIRILISLFHWSNSSLHRCYSKLLYRYCALESK